jgi:hypothetical protein
MGGEKLEKGGGKKILSVNDNFYKIDITKHANIQTK